MAKDVDAFSNIQQAVDNVAVAGIVHVAAGSYTEQIVVSKRLRLVGESLQNTIIRSLVSPGQNFNTGVPNVPVLYVHDASRVEIENVTIDGLGLGNLNQRFMGIAFVNASGSIRNSRITGIRNTPIDGSQQGIGIYLRNLDGQSRRVDIAGNVIDDYQKNGIAVVGEGLFANIEDNDIGGSGPIPELAQNGIQISFGATGRIENNFVHDHRCTSEVAGCVVGGEEGDGDLSSGILMYHPGEGEVLIQSNRLEENQCSICIVGSPFFRILSNELIGRRVGISVTDADDYSDDFGLSSVFSEGDIRSNFVSGHKTGLQILASDQVQYDPEVLVAYNRIVDNQEAGLRSNIFVDAENNWWGCNEGAISGDDCDDVAEEGAGTIDADPWLTMRLEGFPDAVEAGEFHKVLVHFGSSDESSVSLSSSRESLDYLPDETPVTVTLSASGLAAADYEGILWGEREESWVVPSLTEDLDVVIAAALDHEVIQKTIRIRKKTTVATGDDGESETPEEPEGTPSGEGGSTAGQTGETSGETGTPAGVASELQAGGGGCQLAPRGT